MRRMRGLSCGSHRELGPGGERGGVRSPLRRRATLLSLLAATALLVAVVAGWMALGPAASERDPLPEPIRIATVPDPVPSPPPGPEPDVQPPATPDPAAPGTGSGDVPEPSVTPPTSQDGPAPADPAPADPAPADVVPPPPLPDDDADDGDDGDDDGDGDDD